MDWFLIVIMSFLAMLVFASIFEPPTPLASPSDSVDRLD
jgi:hypothetical protein